MNTEASPETDLASPLYLRMEQLLGIDLRSLGIFRILIALLILIDLSVRAESLVAHYTDAGIVPREALYAFGELSLYLSLNALGGGVWLQVVLFTLTALAALALLVGYRTRLATVVCWVLMLSLHLRNPFINNLGDWLLADLLFWSMLLPLGARYSIDGWGVEKGASYPQYVLSVATLAIILQVGFLYFFSTYHKITPEWHTDGTALAFALNLDRVATPFGKMLLSLPPEWLKALSLGAFYLERWGPILLFVPFFIGPNRTLIVGCFIGFHAALAVTMEIGIFPYVCMAAWMLLIPGWAFDRLEKVGKQVGSFVQSRTENVRWEKARATLKRFRKREVQPRVLPNALESLVAVLGLWFVLSSALLYTGKMGEGYYDSLYRYVEPFVNELNLRQRWDMFSPHVPRRDGWFVLAGHQKNGELVDVFTGQPVTWERPEIISAAYRNQRWRKNFEWVMNRWDPHARLMAEYFWAQWNCEHPESENLVQLDIVFMEELTLENLESTPIERKLLYAMLSSDRPTSSCQDY